MYFEKDVVEIMWVNHRLQKAWDWYYLEAMYHNNDYVFEKLWVDKYVYCWVELNSWTFPYHPTLEHINQTIDKLLWKNAVNIYDLIW
jgi:hypothetical protein